MWQPPSAVAIEYDIRNRSRHARFERVAKSAIMFGPLVHLRARKFGGHPQSNNARHAFSSGSSLPFLMSPNILTGQANAAPYVERATTLGRIKLMAGERQQIAAQHLHVQRNSTCCLYRIGVQPK